MSSARPPNSTQTGSPVTGAQPQLNTQSEERCLMRKIFIGVAAAAVIAAPLAATTSANAAVGDEYVQHGGFGDAPANVLPDGSSTEFTPANLSLFGEWANVGKGTMYDPGTFTVASNPASLHEFWAPFPGDDQMMIVNGHTDGTHTV